MADRTLPSMVRLRRLAIAQVRKDLAGCVQAEEQAARAIVAAEASIERERQAAMDLAADDRAVEAFAAWLPVGQQAAEEAKAALAAAAGRTGKMRAELAAALAALEVAETLLAARDAERWRQLERQSQHELEELAQQSGEQRRRGFHS